MCEIRGFIADMGTNNERNSDSMNLTKPLRLPSKEAIEIAARIMANRAKRELTLEHQRTPHPRSKSE